LGAVGASIEDYDSAVSPLQRVVSLQPNNAAARAYTDAARRLEGQDLPMIMPVDRRGFFDRFLGRRAA